MTDPLKKLHALQSELQNIRLTAEEKSDMRAELVRFMNEHPVQEATGNFVRSQKADRHMERTGPLGWFIPFLTPRPMPALLALLLVVFTGGGVSLAANDALPGDLLYPVKVSVNEEVRAAFTFSPASEMEWEIERSERRLVEAERLEAEGKLKSEVAAKLALQVERHDETIAELEMELQSRGQNDLVVGLRAEYEARLLAYESLLYQVLAESRVVAVAVVDSTVSTDASGDANTEAVSEVAAVEAPTAVAPGAAPSVVAAPAASTVAININVAPSAVSTIRLPDLIREFRQEVREERDEKIRPDDRDEGNKTFRDEAAYSREKAKMILERTEELVKKFERALQKLAEARAFYDKGVAEFNAGRFAAAYAHFNNSIAFSNQAENMANQIMADLERADTPDATDVLQGIDFAITNISLPDGFLSITQTNLGDAEYNAFDGHTYIWIDDMRLPKWTYSWATLSNANRLFLNAFGSSLLQPQSLEGKHTVKVCIDALDVAKESNESNNCMTQVVSTTSNQSVQPTPARPVPPTQPSPAPTPVAPTQPVRRFQEILPGDEQYAPKAKTLRSKLENELARFGQLVERYVDQWGKDEFIQKFQNRAEDARVAFQEGDGYLESQNYYWAYVNFSEGLRLMNEVVAEYNALVGSRTDTRLEDDRVEDDRIDDPADREMAPALDAHAKAIAKLKDARECLEGLVKKLGERAVAEAQPYLDRAEAAFSKADAQFERQEYASATENYLDAYEYARIAYDMGQKIKAADKGQENPNNPSTTTIR